MASADKRLQRPAVERLLERMQDDLSRQQLDRLRALAALIGDDGRIALDRALGVATPGGDDHRRQAAFRQFRRVVADAAEAAQVTLALVPDALKLAPAHRFCWFEGEDPVVGELEDMSEYKSRRPDSADVVVPPRVSEVRPPAPVRVHVSAARHSADPSRAGRVEEFTGQLRRHLRTWDSRDVVVTTEDDIELGLPETGERERLHAEADVVVALLTPAYLDEHASDIAELANRPDVLPVMFAALPAAEVSDLGLRRDRMMMDGRPYDSCRQNGREQFAAEVAAAIRRLLDSTLRNPSAPTALDSTAWDDDYSLLEHLSKLSTANRRSADVKVGPRASEIALDPASVGLMAGSHLSRAYGTAVPAVDRLVEWATSIRPAAPRLCALLGDLGMGKTTTAKLFTERLLELRGGGTADAVPVPLLFDLRDISVVALPAQPTLRAVVDLLLTATGGAAQVTTDQVLTAIAKGNCLVIFDGLDEVLVHLSPQQGQLFIRALWQVIDQPRQARRRAAGTAEAAIRPTRLLLTCRTHYFRSIRDEVGTFTGQDRDGPSGRDYLALLMLPFSEDQIRAYLVANVPDMDVDAVLALVESVHNLRELTERPLMLSYVTDQLEFIEQAKLDGRTIRPVNMYGAMVERWITRDNGKHTLLPEHKLEIMEALAARLWRDQRASWSVGDLEQWLLEFLSGRPDLELHYGQRQPELWKEDLRTATFLVRRGNDEFSFAHTSLLEYFLSQHLLRALKLGTDDVGPLTQRWTMPRPSRETLDFLGQGLAGLDEEALQACRHALTALAAEYRPGPSELAFAYGLAAAQAGHPHHRLAGTQLAGADLRGWRFGLHTADTGADQARQTDLLDLTGVVLAGANLSDSRLDGIDLRRADLSHADLTRALLTRSDLRDANLTDSALVGTIVRACRLHGARTASPTIYRAQALMCEPANVIDATGWLGGPVSTRPVADDERLVALIGHTTSVWSAAYSPDGTHLATAGDDGTVRIWDATTGEHLHTLTGHTGTVQSVAYHPDGTHLATAGDDGTVRIWDATTGQHLHTLTGHTRTAWAAAYSPDGTHLATAGHDGTVRIWDATTGQHLHTLTGHTGGVQSLTYSPDGTHLATAGDDGTARIWDATTGQQVGWRVEHLPAGELALWNAETGDLLGATSGAWYWLGWSVIVDGALTRLPAETYGPLPPIPGLAS